MAKIPQLNIQGVEINTNAPEIKNAKNAGDLEKLGIFVHVEDPKAANKELFDALPGYYKQVADAAKAEKAPVVAPAAAVETKQ